MARAVHSDGREAPPGARYITDLDRLEEYSASHAETYDQLGEWPADRFEYAWTSYQVRSGIAAVDAWERGMTESLYANGMIGGDDLSRELDSIRSHSTAMRAKLTGSDLEIEEEELGGDAPYPVTAEANPDGP